MSAESSHLTVNELLRHADWVRALARRLTGDDELADDLAQETWVAALRNPPASETPARTWLARVLRNFARQERRGAGHRVDRERASARPEALLSGEEVVSRVEAQRELVEEALALDDPLRQRLFERYFEGLSAVEIARLRGVPAGTVRWQLKQAVEELRDRLDRRHGGDRRAWLALLAPLGRDFRPATPTFPLVHGVLAMSTATKILFAGTIAVALGVGLSLTGVLPDFSFLPAAPEQQVDVAYRPLADATRSETVSPSNRVSARSPAAPSTNDASEVAEGTGSSARLRARILDDTGRPIAGATLAGESGRGLAIEATSDARGEIDVAVAVPGSFDGSRLLLRVAASAPGRTRVSQETELRRGETVWLADYRLGAAGAVSGRIVDPEGRGIVGATVAIVEPSLEDFRFAFNPGLAAEGGVAMGVPSFRHFAADAPRAETDASGRFLVTGVAVGPLRAASVGPGRLAAFSDVFQVRSGEEALGVELVLGTLPAENRIAGRVVTPDGLPVPFARFEYRSDTANGTGRTAADGSFEWIVGRGERRHLRASDPEGAFGAAEVELVAGDSGIELQLTELANVELLVRTRMGEPVERYGAAVVSVDGDATLATLELADRTDGRARLRVPDAPFRVEVRAPGHAIGSAGPFAGGTAHELVEVRLELLPGVHGVVFADGRPVPGAEVALHRACATHTVQDGFPVRFEPRPQETVTTDAEGSFAITLREAGTWTLLASTERRVLAELGPLDLDPGVGAAGLVLQASAFGAIAGEVRSSEGQAVTGSIVAVSRGDGHPRSQRVGPDGLFRFGELVPGPWQVALVDAETGISGTHVQTSSSPPREIEWSSDVRPGTTTRHDLWIDGEAPLELTGTLAVDGQPAVGWTATLFPMELDVSEPPPSSSLDAEGRFSLSVPSAGRRRLIMSPSGAEAGELRLLDVVDVEPGTEPWRLELWTGALAGHLSPEHRGREKLVGLWDGGGALSAMIAIVSDEDGAFRATRVPSGLVRIVPMVREVLFDPDSVESLAEVEVVPGGEARVDL